MGAVKSYYCDPDSVYYKNAVYIVYSAGTLVRSKKLKKKEK